MKSVQALLHWKSARVTDVKTMTTLALLIALYCVLQMVTINLSTTLRISFSFIALALSCALYGFWPNVAFALIADFAGYLVHPDGVYMPLFALILVVKAAIYTWFFYQRKTISIGRLILAQFVAVVVCNVLLNPLALTLMYGMPYWVLVTSRLIKNGLCFVFECAALYVAFKTVLPLAYRTSKVRA